MPAHRYDRLLDSENGNSLAQLVQWIPEGSTVLELGPASGYFTRYLKESLGCVVDAVELDATMAVDARQWCRQLIVGNLESLVLDEHLPKAAYDIILIADVLEHLRDPALLLQRLCTLIKPEGACLVSIPNIAYGGVIASLLQGEFTYRSEGLLDRTHLRFFTQQSFASLLTETGWYPWAWEAVALPYLESEFRLRMETLPKGLLDFFQSREQLQCYQWLVQAKLSPPATPAASPENWPGDRFPLRLFWSADEDPFDYLKSQVVWGTVGAEQQVQSFVLPVDQRISNLRLRPADRTGFMRLYGITITDRDGNLCWHWSSADGGGMLSKQYMDMAMIDAQDHVLIMLQSPESWFDFLFCASAENPPSVVHVRLGWPMSSDFEVARNAWENVVPPLLLEIDTLKSLVALRDTELSGRDDRLVRQEQLLNDKSTALAELVVREQRLVTDLQSRNEQLALLSAQTTTLQSKIARMETFSCWIKRPLDWLRKLV